MHLATATDLLIIALLISATAVVWKLYQVLGAVQKSLAGVEETRSRIDKTVDRLNSITGDTEKLLTQEIVPLLQTSRETITNLEIATRAVADTTILVRRITGTLDSTVNPERVSAAGKSLVAFAAKQSARAAQSLLSGLSTSLGAAAGALLARRKRAAERKPAARIAPAQDSAADKKVEEQAVPATKARAS
ncbi:MAG TPA: hypothetical protein VGS41_13660 [Chthonomonadales bacterium]|nr:hypothetical protein [Chthonomonadales bacterium]